MHTGRKRIPGRRGVTQVGADPARKQVDSAQWGTAHGCFKDPKLHFTGEEEGQWEDGEGRLPISWVQLFRRNRVPRGLTLDRRALQIQVEKTESLLEVGSHGHLKGCSGRGVHTHPEL